MHAEFLSENLKRRTLENLDVDVDERIMILCRRGCLVSTEIATDRNMGPYDIVCSL
jgi:predicted metal-binding protein